MQFKKNQRVKVLTEEIWKNGLVVSSRMNCITILCDDGSFIQEDRLLFISHSDAPIPVGCINSKSRLKVGERVSFEHMNECRIGVVEKIKNNDIVASYKDGDNITEVTGHHTVFQPFNGVCLVDSEKYEFSVVLKKRVITELNNGFVATILHGNTEIGIVRVTNDKFSFDFKTKESGEVDKFSLFCNNWVLEKTKIQREDSMDLFVIWAINYRPYGLTVNHFFQDFMSPHLKKRLG